MPVPFWAGRDVAAAVLTLFSTLIAHLLVTVWWAASLTKRVDHIERWINNNERTAERLAALEQQINSISGALSRIERFLRPKA